MADYNNCDTLPKLQQTDRNRDNYLQVLSQSNEYSELSSNRSNQQEGVFLEPLLVTPVLYDQLKPLKQEQVSMLPHQTDDNLQELTELVDYRSKPSDLFQTNPQSSKSQEASENLKFLLEGSINEAELNSKPQDKHCLLYTFTANDENMSVEEVVDLPPPLEEEISNQDVMDQVLVNNEELCIHRKDTQIASSIDESGSNTNIILPDVPKIQYDHAVEERVLSADGGRKTRRQFCTFCKKLVAKLPNHVEAVHKEEEIVKKLKNYPKEVTIRPRWSPRSLNTLETAFKHNIFNNCLPSMSDIRSAKLMYPALELRGTPTIKTAISNRLKKLYPTKAKKRVFLK